MLKNARIERGISQANLALRLNVSRYSVMALEKGDPGVAIGTVFEAAAIVGLPLLAENVQMLKKMNYETAHLQALLPKRVYPKRGPIDNDF